MDIGVSAMVTPGWSVTNAKPDSWWGSLPRWDRRMLAALFWPGDPAPTIWYSVLLGRTFEDPPTPEAFRLRAEI
ncbi:hypothetical protein, partial [Tessaracoccus sp. G1721]